MVIEPEASETNALRLILNQIFSCDDPWAALSNWLAEQRAINAERGGDDDLLIGLIVQQTLQLGVPIAS